MHLLHHVNLSLSNRAYAAHYLPREQNDFRTSRPTLANLKLQGGPIDPPQKLGAINNSTPRLLSSLMSTRRNAPAKRRACRTERQVSLPQRIKNIGILSCTRPWSPESGGRAETDPRATSLAGDKRRAAACRLTPPTPGAAAPRCGGHFSGSGAWSLDAPETERPVPSSAHPAAIGAAAPAAA